MLKQLAPFSFVLALGCQPAPAASPQENSSAQPELAKAGQRALVELPEPPPFEESRGSGVADSPQSARPAPGDEAFELLASPEEIEKALESAGPLAPEFAALPRPIRSAVELFFARGPGAATPDTGMTGAEALIATRSGGSINSAQPTVRGDPVPGYPGLFNVTLLNTGSGYVEKFLLQLPDVPPSGATPLLVVFHKYGVSHADVLYHTSFVAEARARGWYMVAPLGYSGQNFGSITSQINVQAALACAMSWVPIDRMRIYGVGFSMGGGGAASYAARHHAPGQARFAALANHTGTVSLAHAYANESSTIQTKLENLFGGSPAANPFAYQRCSTIDLDPSSNSVQSGSDMARNLRHVPIHDWLASNDPQQYLPQQSLAFDAHVHPMHPANTMTVVQDGVHDWSSLDETVLCDWFASFTLAQPTSGTLLADQSGAWHRFMIDQDQSGAFTSVDWSAIAAQNRIDLAGTSNLAKIAIAAQPLGLVYQGSLAIDVSSADGTGDQVQLREVSFGPNAAYRNGVPASTTYDPATKTLQFDEPGGAGTAHWVIVF
jgi:hypothetical protein